MTSLAAMVVTYRRPVVLREFLERLLAQTHSPDYVLVVDNAASADTEEVVRSFGVKHFGYAAMADNVGPAGAVAYALERLVLEGFDWIYWGDDDDPPAFDDVLERVFCLAQASPADVGAVGAVGTRFDWGRGETVRIADEKLTGVVDVDFIAGNSQLTVRGAAVHRVGVPNGRLFFGYEELEYCIRLRRANYRLLVDGELMYRLRVKYGRTNFARASAIVPRQKYDDIWRQYYSTRNYIHMMRNEFGRPDLARREAAKAILHLFTSWSRGYRYGMRYSQLQLRGIVDGYRAKLGRTVEPRAKQGVQ